MYFSEKKAEEGLLILVGSPVFCVLKVKLISAEENVFRVGLCSGATGAHLRGSPSTHLSAGPSSHGL